MGLILAGDVKCNRKGFYKYINCRRKTRENVGTLLGGTEALVTKDMKKAEILNVFVTSVFTCKTGLQEPKAIETREEKYFLSGGLSG